MGSLSCSGKLAVSGAFVCARVFHLFAASSRRGTGGKIGSSIHTYAVSSLELLLRIPIRTALPYPIDFHFELPKGDDVISNRYVVVVETQQPVARVSGLGSRVYCSVYLFVCTARESPLFRTAVVAHLTAHLVLRSPALGIL